MSIKVFKYHSQQLCYYITKCEHLLAEFNIIQTNLACLSLWYRDIRERVCRACRYPKCVTSEELLLWISGYPTFENFEFPTIDNTTVMNVRTPEVRVVP